MKTRYLYLRDRRNQVRVVICCLSPHKDHVYYGMAIRSDEDNHDETTGKRLAYARAVRAWHNRRPCFVNTVKALKNLWQLKFEDFRLLSLFSGGFIEGMAKGDPIDWVNDWQELMKEIEYVKSNTESCA